MELLNIFFLGGKNEGDNIAPPFPEDTEVYVLEIAFTSVGNIEPLNNALGLSCWLVVIHQVKSHSVFLQADS